MKFRRVDEAEVGTDLERVAKLGRFEVGHEVARLRNARGLDQDAVTPRHGGNGAEGGEKFDFGARAEDAAPIDLVLGELARADKLAVDAQRPELVDHQCDRLAPPSRFGQQMVQQGRLARAEETGNQRDGDRHGGCYCTSLSHSLMIGTSGMILVDLSW